MQGLVRLAVTMRFYGPTQRVHCKTCKAGPIHAKESMGRCGEKEESPCLSHYRFLLYHR